MVTKKLAKITLGQELENFSKHGYLADGENAYIIGGNRDETRANLFFLDFFIDFFYQKKKKQKPARS